MKLTNKQQEIIKKLGLSDTQLLLYMSSLENGLLTVIELSKITGLSRQKIYEDAERLVKMGLYDVTRKQGRKYIPAHPSKLLGLGQVTIENLQSNLGEIAKLIPVLESSNVPKKNAINVKYFEGRDRVTKAYENQLEACVNINVDFLAGSIDDVLKFYPEEYWDVWNKKFVKQGSSSRMLAHDSKAARLISRFDKVHNRETRLIENFSLKFNIDIFNDVVLIVSFYDELAIWLESKMLADSYRILFNTLWQIAEPVEKK